MSEDFPGVFPYPDRERGHTSGWSGSETSKESAYRRDSDGTTRTTQQALLALLRDRKEYGATYLEGCTELSPWPNEGGGHSTVSSAMSNLFKVGKALRLTDERRSNCAVFVLPGYEAGRAFDTPPKDSLAVRRLSALDAILKRAEDEGRTHISIKALRTVLSAKEFKEKEQ